VIEHCRSKNHQAWVIGNVTSNAPGIAAALEGVPA
jgi:phosphoribosylformylglycinamidine cyclo-ligase